MRQQMIAHNRGTPARVERHQDVTNFDLAEGLDRRAMMQDEHCSQTAIASHEGNFIVLDDTSRRYSDTRALNTDSGAYLEGCLRVLQSIVGPVRRKEI
jgi:hypothetical protein